MANFDDMKLAVESLTGGKNTVLLDDAGLPSVVVVFPKHTNKELFGGSVQTHSGHIVNGVEKSVMYVDKFKDIVYGGRGYSLPMRDPAAYVNFDQAVTYARAKGTGWGLLPFALHSEIALWCRANGTMPRGNNNFGADVSRPLEKGVGTYYDSANKQDRRTATGSGPETWNHDGTVAGITDLNGNINEWWAGCRIVNGEIQIIPNCNCMLQDVSLGSSSTSWKAIAADGTLVEPGTSGTLKFTWANSAITLTSGNATVEDIGRYTEFKSLALASGLTVPEIIKELALYPAETGGDYGGDGRWLDTSGERVALGGGDWYDGSTAGVFYVGLYAPRSGSNDNRGFRSAFCKL